MKVIRALLITIGIAACFVAGLYGGPLLKQGYARIFPAPSYVKGNFSKLYAEAGRQVVLFSTSTCPFCKKTRALLDKQGVAYVDYVTDQSPDAEKKFKQLNGSAVPLIFVGDRRILGFNESSLDAALKLLPYDADSIRPSGHS